MAQPDPQTPGKLGQRILLIVAMALAGSCATIVAAWHAAAQGARAAEQSTLARLTSIREAKRRDITGFVEDTVAATERLARAPWVVEAMRDFQTAFPTLEPLPGAGARVAEYYEQEVAPRLNGGRSEIPAASLVPDDPAAVAAQDLYIAANPHEVGSKEQLDRAGDGAYAREHARYHHVFRDEVETFEYYDLFLITPNDGRIVYSVFKEVDFGTRLIAGPHAGSGLAQAFDAAVTGEGGGVLVDFQRYAPSYLEPAAFIAAPIRDAGQTIGVLAVQVPVGKIDEVMTGQGHWVADGLGVSGETYLVGRDHLMRSRSRFLIEDPDGFGRVLRGAGVDAEVIRRIGVFDTTILFQPVRTPASEAALAGESGTDLVDDYRGVSVLSSFAPLRVAGLDWAILSEMDEDEAFAASRSLRRQVALMTGFAVVGFALAAWVLARALVRSERQSLHRARIERDLSVARDIQQSLLPQTAPNIPGYELSGWSRPADATGGDYYDWQALPGNRLVVSLADVTGHGIGPALVTAVCRAYARASFAEDGNLEGALTRINDFLHSDLPDGRFVTFVVAQVDGQRHQVELLSAGHGPLLVYHARSREVEMLAAHEVPLAVTESVSFAESDRIDAEPGDVVLLVTDGFFEWANPRGELFGIDRLAEVLRCHANSPPTEIIEALYRQVLDFSDGTPQDDDLTAVAIKRLPTPA